MPKQLEDVTERLVGFRHDFERIIRRRYSTKLIGAFTGDDQLGQPITEFTFDYLDGHYQVSIKELHKITKHKRKNN